MITKFCIIHNNFFPVEHDNLGNEGHIVIYGSMFDKYGDEPSIDWCDFPLCDSEPPDNLTEDEWETIFADEYYLAVDEGFGEYYEY
jgi:hypothetical protein